jgi:spermidine/putrescine transport system substrate-binding protein
VSRNDESGADGTARGGISRRELLRRSSAFAGALALGNVLAACGGGDEESAAPAEPAEPAAPAAEQAAPGSFEGVTLNWLTWPGHNDPSFVGPFTEKTGIQLKAKEYAAGEQALIEITQNPGTWDVVTLAGEYTQQLQQAGGLEELDPAEYPGYADFFPEFKEDFPGVWVGDRLFTMLYRFGNLSLTYRTDKLSEQDVQSWEVLWDERIKGKVGWFDWWANGMGAISRYVGNSDAYQITDEEFAKLVDSLHTLKPQTAGFYSIADIFSGFANGTIWAQPGGGDWSALLLQAEGDPIGYAVPQEGAAAWTETLSIVKGTKNLDAAKEFVKYVVSPEGQGLNAILPSYQATVPSQAGWVYLQENYPEWAERLNMTSLESPNALDPYREGRISIRLLPTEQTIEEWQDAWTEFKSI